MPLRLDGDFGARMTRLDNARDSCGASSAEPVTSEVATELDASSENSIDKDDDR